ncbi:MAG TPA: hypothetical protein VJ779_17390 [Acetobacteraceae bacterium]|nr:hypothetical protein [Acetobacteraceae bacterium]
MKSHQRSDAPHTVPSPRHLPLRSMVLAAAALALSGGGALAAGGAIANSTTTSMGAPAGSPGYSAPRSEVVPGVPRQERRAEESNETPGQPATQRYATPVPSGTDNHVQVTR